jgi:Undecaprenyl-phosphate glucose phosphotransferase
VPANLDGLPVLGTINDLERCVRTYPIHQVIIPLPFDPHTDPLDWMSKLRKLPVDVCPGMSDLHLEPACSKLSYLSGIPLLNVLERPLTGWNWVIKNVEDRLLAALILPIAAPLMGVIALAIKLDSPGPVLFKQKRYGFNNEVINVFKFRSMYCEHSQDSSQIEQAKRGDPRVTRVGRFIRRTSLDELPQLLNVLKGDMSIVGPRPHAVAHNEHYARLIEEYVGRHRVKPGITGWAQVSGLRGETETLEKMRRRLEYDLNYIENWSVLFDLRIILKTLVVGFVSRNAY